MTDTQIKEALTLAKKGYSVLMIGAIVGADESAVDALLAQHGLL